MADLKVIKLMCPQCDGHEQMCLGNPRCDCCGGVGFIPADSVTERQITEFVFALNCKETRIWESIDALRFLADLLNSRINSVE